nr:beta-1 adrenergic receptor-like [Biomphalaria glabrata]
MSRHESPAIDGNVTSFDREYLHWSFIIIEVAAIVVIVIGDISMLMMFFTRKLLGQSTNILVFSVGIGDLVTGLLALPLAMMQKILMEPSDFLCKGYFYFANVSKTAVGYTILLLAMERILAVLMHTFRILPPGRCLFFASLTWFFSAAYNIWSVVIYDVENVNLLPAARSPEYFLCFASNRFMYLHDIFAVLNPLVTFTFPALCSSLLFLYFLRNKREADKPGRPYKSSKSVVIFTFALLVSFVASHLPWEIATLVLNHDAPAHYADQLISLKVLHLISFSRGFWDIFIFGAFRHYVCKKEKALAHFREQRSLQVQRSNLAIPMSDRPMSTSLLDSDPSVSRRYSSDISRRASAFDDPHSCQIEHHPGVTPQEDDSHLVLINNYVNVEDSSLGAANPAAPQLQIPVVTYTYLVPRSPCAWENTRNLMFPPNKPPVVDLNRRNTLTGKSRFGSCEMIPESSESDSVAEMGDPAKKQQYQRRKSCGDKVSHLKVRASKHAMLKHSNSPENIKACVKLIEDSADLNSNDSDGVILELRKVPSPVFKRTLHIDQPSPVIDHDSDRLVLTIDNASKNNNKIQLTDCLELNRNYKDSLPLEKGNSPSLTTSRSADAIGSPTLKSPSPEIRDDSRRNTLTVPTAVPRRGTSCNYLTVPSSITPFFPGSS